MIKVIQIGESDKKIREVVARELEASWPVPVEKAIILFYYARYGPPPATVDQLYPPSWVVWLSPENGTVLKIEKKNPSFFGLSGPPDRPFAVHAFPDSWTPDIVKTKTAELLDCMDALYPRWMEGQPPDVHRKSQFRELFPELAAPPMLTCYQHVSPHFFSWVELS